MLSHKCFNSFRRYEVRYSQTRTEQHLQQHIANIRERIDAAEEGKNTEGVY
jgi:hypothetical protein